MWLGRGLAMYKWSALPIKFRSLIAPCPNRWPGWGGLSVSCQHSTSQVAFNAIHARTVYPFCSLCMVRPGWTYFRQLCQFYLLQVLRQVIRGCSEVLKYRIYSTLERQNLMTYIPSPIIEIDSVDSTSAIYRLTIQYSQLWPSTDCFCFARISRNGLNYTHNSCHLSNI